jgi:hypothetical protein
MLVLAGLLLLGACGSEDSTSADPCSACPDDGSVCFLNECLCQSVRPLDLCTPGFPQAPRWGTSAVLVGYLAEEQLIQPGSVVLLGGAEPQASCTAWDDPSCLGELTDIVEIFNHRDCTFTVLGSAANQKLKTPRAFAATATLPDGRIAIFGGFDAEGQPLASVEILDPFTGTIAQAPAMEKTRALHTATLVGSEGDGHVLLAGGLGTGTNSLEVWSPADGTVGLSNLNHGRYRHTATLVEDTPDARDMVILAGGEDGTDALNTFEIFDLSLMTPALDNKLYPLCTNDVGAIPAVAMTMHQAALVAKHGLIYFVGGFKNQAHTTPSNNICALDVDTEEFNLDAQEFLKLDGGRAAFAATLLSDGAVAFTGGLSGTDLAAVDTSEVLFDNNSDLGQLKVDLSNNIQTLTTPRFQHSAVATCEDRILVVGGAGLKANGLEPVASSQILLLDW